MAKENVSSINYKELYAQYNWFSQNYPQAIQNACDEFFLPGFSFILLGISKNVNALMDKDAYFVTKVCVDKNHDLFFRFSENSIGIILDKILGKPNSRFNLNKLTDLEAKIITSFNDYLYHAIEKFLQPAPPTLKRTNFDVIHLTFLLKNNDNSQTGKFIVTLPEILLSPETITPNNSNFNYDNFASSTMDASIKIGSTRLKLIDVKNIDIDDIVVFDNSNTKHMVLKINEYEKDVKLNPNLGIVLPFENDEGEDNMANNTNLWDSIEVEMNAHFDTVKITLGELKSIEEGLVVDLTSIYNNKVTLTVEDKPIARGELVIVNDRYGVKVEEVIANTSQPKPQANNYENIEYNEEPQYTENNNDIEYMEQPQNDMMSEEDEFDYSDFELEDDDI